MLLESNRYQATVLFSTVTQRGKLGEKKEGLSIAKVRRRCTPVFDGYSMRWFEGQKADVVCCSTYLHVSVMTKRFVVQDPWVLRL
jgi:hypothetical protein